MLNVNTIKNKAVYFYEKFCNDYLVKKIKVQNFKIVADKYVHKPGKSSLFFVKVLKKYIQPTDTILDVGTGCGILAILLSKYAKKIIGIEINKKAVDCAQENILSNGIKNVEIRQSDMFKNIKQKEKFNMIIMNLQYLIIL